MARISRSTADLLKEMREAIALEHGESRAERWDPLIELAVYAADPALPPIQKATANRELAQYLYPKLKAVEHTGGGGGLTLLLARFSEDGRVIIDGQLGNPESEAADGSQALPPTQQQIEHQGPGVEPGTDP